MTLDRLYFAGRSAEAPGGAGLYTALAAAHSGAQVTLFAQRPVPLPAPLRRIDQHVHWVGPEIPLESLPRLEIVHHGGGWAELKRAKWGAQLDLWPVDLPFERLDFGRVHIAALGPTSKQLNFLAHIREHSGATISAGTYGKAAWGEPDQVRTLLQGSDYFFMNENECRALFGGPDDVPFMPEQAVFVTLGKMGAWGISGNLRVHVRSRTVDELDPTGAGDAFCGGVLAGLERGADLVEAMEGGAGLAAEVVQGIGPSRLLIDQGGISAGG